LKGTVKTLSRIDGNFDALVLLIQGLITDFTAKSY